MRKGIVMEQKKGYTIVMTHDGNFHRALRLHEAEVGMEVHFQAISNSKHLRPVGWLSNIVPWKAGIMALVLVLACLPFYIKYGSSQAYAYVNIDINPSLELKLNEKLQVIQITPRNEDAEKLMDMLTDWKKKDVSEVAFEMINISQENGWMNQQKQVLIGISYLKTNPTASLAKRMEHELSDRAKDLSVAAYNLPASLREQALEANQSVNEWVAKQLSKKQSDIKGANSIELMSEEKEMIRSFFEESPKRESSENNSSSSLKNIEVHIEEPTDKKSVNSKENKNVNHSSDSPQSSSGDQRGSTNKKNRDTDTPPSSNLKKDKPEKVDHKVYSEDESSEEKKKDEPQSNSQSKEKPDKQSSKDKKEDKPKSSPGQSKEKPDKGSSEDKKNEKGKSNPGQSEEKPDKASSEEKKKDKPNSSPGQSKDKPDKGSSEDKKNEKAKSNPGQSKEKPDKASSEDKKKDKPKSNSGQSKDKSDKTSSKDNKKDKPKPNPSQSKEKREKKSLEYQKEQKTKEHKNAGEKAS